MKKFFSNQFNEKIDPDSYLPEPVRYAEALDARCKDSQGGEKQ